MENSVILVDDQGQVESVLIRLLSGTSYKVESFTDPTLAKRRLLEVKPALIVSLSGFQNHPDGGFRLAKEVSSHEQLSAIPVVLFSDTLSEEVIHQAAESGARTLVPWPVSVDSLRNRLKSFLQLEILKPETAEPLVNEVSEKAEKVQLAQKLLAKVLHNLKTSALLEIIDLEDVPRVVSEMTKAVCVESQGGEQKPAAASPSKNKPEVPLSLDTDSSPPGLGAELDAAFGFRSKGKLLL